MLMIGKGHGSNEVLPILVLANEFSNQCGVSVLCTGFLAAQIWFTKGGVAEYAQLVPDAKREYTELCIG